MCFAGAFFRCESLVSLQLLVSCPHLPLTSFTRRPPYTAWLLAQTFKYVFSPTPSGSPTGTPDLHFCTADIGWVTGHTVNASGTRGRSHVVLQ